MILHPRALVRLAFLLESSNRNRLATLLPPGWERLLEGASALGNSGALGIGGSVGGAILGARVLESHRVDVVPRRMTIRRTPYDEADQVDVEIDFGLLPVDPRLFKEVAIEAHIGVVNEIGEVFVPEVASRLFVGYADEVRQRMSGNAMVIEGRDQTGLLLDRPWTGEVLDLGEPISVLVGGILSAHPATATMRVEVRGPDVVLGQERAETNGQVLAGETTESCWDKISQLAAEAGMVAWVDGEVVVIGESQTLVGDLGGLPALVYGRNLTELRVQRGMARYSSPPVLVVSWDPERRETISAVWPPARPADATGDGLGRSSAAVMYQLSNVKEQGALERAARAIWTRRASQEVWLELETRDMKGGNGEDLTRLKAGSPVRVYITADEEEYLYGKNVGERRRWLEGRGYRAEVASAIAAQYEELAPVYQVRTAVHEWDAASGYRLRLELTNFITVS
jgi:hypothetical protein